MNSTLDHFLAHTPFMSGSVQLARPSGVGASTDTHDVPVEERVPLASILPVPPMPSIFKVDLAPSRRWHVPSLLCGCWRSCLSQGQVVVAPTQAWQAPRGFLDLYTPRIIQERNGYREGLCPIWYVHRTHTLLGAWHACVVPHEFRRCVRITHRRVPESYVPCAWNQCKAMPAL